MKKHILPTAFILSAAAAIACASRPFDSHAPAASTPFAARTIAPEPTEQTVKPGSIRVQETAAGSAGASGASLSNTTSQIGGDLSPSQQKVEHDAQAPAGVPPTPAGAFVSHESPSDGPTPLTVDEFHDLQQWLRDGKPLAEWLAKHPDPALHSAALAQPLAPAAPVNAPAAPVAAAYTPYYPTYRPTFSGYVQQGACGPGGCGPVRGFFGRRR